ncbi:internal scaffolding protein [robinz microvirus RP_78]|nr:internal scaffolding protein [robinz microvirus RP_78]
MRYHGTNSDGETLSSAYVEKLNPEQFSLDCSDLPSLTRQEFADECDINKLMAQYEATGLLPTNLNTGEPRYLDVSNVPDLQTSLDYLKEATASFMALPATVRRDFDNDALKFVEFAENPNNVEKMREWKLAAPKAVEPPPQKVEVINPPPSKDAPAA